MREEVAASLPRLTLRLAAATPERRRVARALLAEGALAAGGEVEEAPGELRLVGAEAARARRLRDLLDKLLGQATLAPWSPAQPRPVVAPAVPTPPPAGLSGLDSWLTGLDPVPVARRRRGWRLAADGTATPGFLRLEVARDTLADRMGALGGDTDLLDHAQTCMEARLLAALAEAPRRRALLGEGPVRQLHLRLPAGTPAALPQGLVVTVPLAAAADPAAMAQQRARLAASGCRLELDGLDAGTLALLDPAALPVDLVRIAWSPALAGPAAGHALAGLDPARIVLAGAEGEAAWDWARRRGLGLLEAEAPA
jgi:hypothetical protein